ncbi:hypothetical protein BP00DRAFT_273075 [Aspergillus indologenus CBS 114.80]|uniref:Uncharacterized protein n=1 Tax=Aspergillus indologenus CBS 114.80 TaxID=1450541 RepID=A0A2V5IVM1_9EURO|nr:hypothetical protein BP00DRAFT_273075 [Aspergillus indologenus CBS 114.80]
MQNIFGLPRTDEDPATYGDAPPMLQTLGSVTATHQGCFLGWPNTLRYRTLPFITSNPYPPGPSAVYHHLAGRTHTTAFAPPATCQPNSIPGGERTQDSTTSAPSLDCHRS